VFSNRRTCQKFILNETGSVANTPLKNEDGADIPEHVQSEQYQLQKQTQPEYVRRTEEFLLLNNAALRLRQDDHK